MFSCAKSSAFDVWILAFPPDFDGSAELAEVKLDSAELIEVSRGGNGNDKSVNFHFDEDPYSCSYRISTIFFAVRNSPVTTR